MHNVYIASPFFNEEQLQRLESIENLLDRLNISYFSPRKELVCPPTATEKQREETFRGNCKGIRDADIIIAITDGKDVGTIWEMGYGFGCDIPVVGVAFTLGNNPFNLMLSESCITTCKTLEQLEDFLVNGTTIYYQGEIE